MWIRVLLEKLNSSAASRDFPRIVLYLKVHYRVQKSPPFVPICSQIIQAPPPPQNLLLEDPL